MSHDTTLDQAAARAEAAYLYGGLEQVELALAEMYGWLAGVFSDDDEARALFAKMQAEELRHVEWVRERQVKAESGEQVVPDVRDEDAELVIAAVENFREKRMTPELEEAILFVLELEHTTAEAHRRIAERSDSGKNNPLIASLSAADDRHVIDLHTFALSRGIRAFGA